MAAGTAGSTSPTASRHAGGQRADRLAFRGTDDAHLGRDDYSTVAGPADPGADLNIGVTHAPYLRLLDAMTADGMDLIFAGHTHGGQVCVPGYGALITNCDLDPARVKGPLHAFARAARTCTSRPGWAPPRSPRTGSRAAPR